MKNLANNNRFNKDIMIESECMDSLEKLSTRVDLSQEAGEMCHELSRRLKELMPSQLYHGSPSRGTSTASSDSQNSNRSHMENGNGIDHLRIINFPDPIKREKPQVVWCQS